MSTENALATINPKTIYSELQKFKGQMEAALPRHMTPDRMARIALTQLRVTPKLFTCSAESFYASLMAASQLGLEPGIMGQCYLIPYWNAKLSVNICTLIPGWRGFMELLSRTGRANAWTNAVYDGDVFDFEYGDKPFIRHKPGKWAGNPEALTYTYAVGRQKDAEWPALEVWDIDKIWAHRDKNNKVGDRHYSFIHPEMYARKIPLLQVLKYLPSSIELANASALDIVGTEGNQNLTIDLALKGELENGGADPLSQDEATESAEQAARIENLITVLEYPEAQRRKIKTKYIGRDKELLEWLTGEVAKKQNTGGKKEPSAPNPPAPAQASTTPAMQISTSQSAAPTTAPTENPDAEPPQDTKPSPAPAAKAQTRPAPLPLTGEEEF